MYVLIIQVVLEIQLITSSRKFTELYRFEFFSNRGVEKKGSCLKVQYFRWKSCVRNASVWSVFTTSECRIELILVYTSRSISQTPAISTEPLILKKAVAS